MLVIQRELVLLRIAGCWLTLWGLNVTGTRTICDMIYIYYTSSKFDRTVSQKMQTIFHGGAFGWIIVGYSWQDWIHAGSLSDAADKVGSMLVNCQVQLIGSDPCRISVW